MFDFFHPTGGISFEDLGKQGKAGKLLPILKVKKRKKILTSLLHAALVTLQSGP